MCWTGKLEDYRVAEEPIRVIKMLFKVGDSKYQAPYQKDFYYLIKTPYYNGQFSVKFDGDNLLQISQGFHSYAFDKVYKLEKKTDIYKQACSCIIDLGKNKLSMGYWADQNLVACKGIIPRSSHYFINSIGEIVSDSIYLTEEIKLTGDETIINEKLCVG